MCFGAAVLFMWAMVFFLGEEGLIGDLSALKEFSGLARLMVTFFYGKSARIFCFMEMLISD